MTDFFDAMETRDPAQREAALLAALPMQVAHARLASPAFAEILKDVNPADVTTREAIEQENRRRNATASAKEQREGEHPGDRAAAERSVSGTKRIARRL